MKIRDPSQGYYQLATQILELAIDHKSNGDYKEAIHLLEHGSQILSDYPKGKTLLLALFAELLWKTGDIQRAEKLLDQEHPETDEKTLSEILYELAEVHYILKYFMFKETDQDPLELHQKALNLRRDAGYLEGVSESLSRIGTMYEHQKDYEKAQPYYMEAIGIAKSINYPRGLTRPYTHMAAYQREQGNHDESYNLYSESLRISEEVGPAETLLLSLANMAQAEYSASGDLEKAISLDMRALKIAEKTGFILAHARVHLGIALLYMQSKYNEKAINHFRKVIEIAEEAGYCYFTKPAEDYIKELE